MAFKEVLDLETDTTTALGGINRKTGKPNPKSVEGYFIGSRQVDSPKSKGGKAFLHVFETSKGKVGVWGKTDMDRKLTSAPLGAMTRVTHTGMQATKNGEMYKYKIEVDAENTIDVPNNASANPQDEVSDSVQDDDTDPVALDADDEPLDEIEPARPVARATAVAPDAARRAQVQALLTKTRKTA